MDHPIRENGKTEYLARCYYRIKPFVPRSLQLIARRKRASIQRRKFAGIWPIDPSAGRKPLGWTGWPENKRFALVLTHDVDSTKGYSHIADLIACEREMGFRSCFNFVAEGYDISDDIRNELQHDGFEVGVHGLTHDGLFFVGSDKEFLTRAVRINSYLDKWGAVGFRAPTMRRDFNRLMRLNIAYDSSSFDTDPFEPDPDGVATIFPFLVYLPSRSTEETAFLPHEEQGVRFSCDYPLGNDHVSLEPPASHFVELPYTLPQDHCLFIILREKTNGIWKEKLDWIAENGGMALLNAHPDYMSFSGHPNGPEEYPVEMYREFLSHVKARYANEYWHALPREVSAFWLRNVRGHRSECTVEEPNGRNGQKL